MPRRTIVLCMTAYTAGIAVQHAVSDILSFIFMLSLAAVSSAATIKIYADIREKVWCGRDAGYDLSDSGVYHRKVFRIGVCLFVLFFILGSVMGSFDENRKTEYEYIWGSNIDVQGKVTRVDIKDDGKYDLILKIKDTGEKMLISVRMKGDSDTVYSGRSSAHGTGEITADITSAADLTGRVIRVGGAVEKPAGALNPGGFDYSLYLRSIGVLSLMHVDEKDIEVTESKLNIIWNVMNRLAVGKAVFEATVFDLMDRETSGFLCGMMFGDDGLMEKDLQEVFRYAGTGHLLAVSGLHVGMVYGVFYILLGKPVSFWGNLPLGLLMVGYAAVSGFSPSVVRAVFMIVVNIVSRIDHRRYDFLTCASFCGGIMLLARPTKLFSSGFQLSFMAVLSLCVVMPRLQRFIKMPEYPDRESADFSFRGYVRVELKRRMIQFVLLTVSLQLCLTPLTIYIFHYWSPAGMLVNSPSIVLAGIIVPLGMGLMGLMLFSGAAGNWAAAGISGHMIDFIRGCLKFAASAEEMLIKVLIWINETADRIIGFKYVPSPAIWVLVLYYLVLFFLCSEIGEAFLKALTRGQIRTPDAYGEVEARLPAGDTKKANGSGFLWRPLAVLAAAAAAVSFCFYGALSWEYMMADAVFLDVGQGDCCHIKAENGTDILCDSGGSDIRDVGTDVLIPYFLGSGVGSIDLAVISHLHTDHYKGLVTMSAGVKIEKLLLSAAYEAGAKSISEETGVAVEDMVFARAGDIIDAGGGVRIRVLAPTDDTADGSDENEACLVYQVCYKDRSILFTGDIDSEHEEKLVEHWGGEISSDILKIAHHGSRFSSCREFLKAVDSEISVIQVGSNVYGHPTQEAMDRITESGSALYRNDENGAIMIDLDGSELKTYTMK